VRIEEAIKSDSKTFFGYDVDLKKKRVSYPSVMHFEGHLSSTNDVWVPSDPVPEHVPDDPPFGALQFTSDEVENVLQDLDVN
jgi:hypothetical protein